MIHFMLNLKGFPGNIPPDILYNNPTLFFVTSKLCERTMQIRQ
jgi:hypothetical protein